LAHLRRKADLLTDPELMPCHCERYASARRLTLALKMISTACFEAYSAT
jgi:hypothetical protein